MKLNCKKIKLWINFSFAVILIVADLISVLVLVRHHQKSDATSPTSLSWGEPSSIVLSYNNKQVTVTPDSTEYKKLLELNAWRSELIEYYSEIEYTQSPHKSILCMEYHYKKPHTLFLPMTLENRTFSTKKICFYLTGENNNTFCIDADKRQFYATPLNTNVELIKTATQLLG